jgi:hypothetical protein
MLLLLLLLLVVVKGGRKDAHCISRRLVLETERAEGKKGPACCCLTIYLIQTEQFWHGPRLAREGRQQMMERDARV